MAQSCSSSQASYSDSVLSCCNSSRVNTLADGRKIGDGSISVTSDAFFSGRYRRHATHLLTWARRTRVALLLDFTPKLARISAAALKARLEVRGERNQDARSLDVPLSFRKHFSLSVADDSASTDVQWVGNASLAQIVSTKIPNEFIAFPAFQPPLLTGEFVGLSPRKGIP